MGKYINKIIHGDCLEVMKGIPDGVIDMILADLPYGTTACKWDTIIPFELLWKQYERIIKPSGAIVLFSGEPFTSTLICSNIKLFRYRWTWNKLQAGNWQLANVQPLNVIEDICVFSIGKAANGAKLKMNYFPIKITGQPEVTSGGTPARTEMYNSNSMKAQKQTRTDRFPISLLTYKKVSTQGRLHPTQKPVDLCEYIIKTYTNENDIVLDNVIGSGTTAIACMKTNRRFIGIELDKTYVEVARDRVENFNG
jgi:site-specific DNA-methyltransferase (adenine-specific)